MDHKYGTRKDIPDQRDEDFAYTVQEVKYPLKFSLSQYLPDVYDQGNLGSCTANAIAGAVEYLLRTQKNQMDFMPSRLFIYYNERDLEGTTAVDAGASIRDGIKTINRQGVCREMPTWPYIISMFSVKPYSNAYKEAILHEGLKFLNVQQSLWAFFDCLSIARKPVVIGMSIYESFETDKVAKTGIVPMPKRKERLLGGHAVLVVGFDQTTREFVVRNSWGTDWGIHGYFRLPFDYLMDPSLAWDFWAIDLMK